MEGARGSRPALDSALGVSRRELLWVLGWSLVVLGLTSLPYLWCAALETDTHVFGGLVYDVEDVRTYLAEMRQGARGAWLLHLPYTSEDHPRAFVHGLYLLLGRLVPLAGGSLLAVFHLARWALGLAALVSVYRFVAFFTPWMGTRRVAWLLAAFSSGLGWLLVLLGRSQWLGDMPVDFWVPEAFTLPVLYSFPHIALSLALLLEALLGFVQAVERSDLRPALRGGLLTLALGFVVPFDVPVVYGVMGAYLLALLLGWRRLARQALLAALVVGGISLPGLAYNLWVFTFNGAFREWARQNLGFSPHPAHFLVAYAPLALLALPGIVHVLQRGDRRGAFLVAWLLAAAALLYTPFNLQRRLLIGLHPVLCLLAAVGLTRWFLPRLGWSRAFSAIQEWSRGRYRRKGLRRLAVYGVVWALVPSNLLLLAGPMIQALEHVPPLYLPREAVDAADWLAAHAPAESVVLASPAVGNFLPVRSDVWVFLGHGAITLQYDAKLEEARRFYRAGGQTPEAAYQWLLDRGIRYVYFGPDEKRLVGGESADLFALPYLQLAYENQGVSLFAVARP